ncbi:hypothetical protein [Curtobacterium sp. MCSS17_016]|uniref:hypothetical protein n=1 Tax=Curtobacterium sp. MCSS17_016 TaxID=2175644 RepID=UPI000DAA3FF0|nr:hypothetical protein [Curtobacterium sp. MCSS17_016]WIE81050.1 hypothetical protein DEJ19_021270 [Curtobacterium sp. MCSS17_016]
MPLPSVTPPASPQAGTAAALELVAHNGVVYSTAEESYRLTRALPSTTPAPAQADFDLLLLDGLIAFNDPWAVGNLALHLTTAGRVARNTAHRLLVAA